MQEKYPFSKLISEIVAKPAPDRVRFAAEMIRKGATIRPQCHRLLFGSVDGKWGSCALGAMIEAVAGVADYRPKDDVLNDYYGMIVRPILNRIMLPGNEVKVGTRHIPDVIELYNDELRKTREEIADLLDAVAPVCYDASLEEVKEY